MSRIGGGSGVAVRVGGEELIFRRRLQNSVTGFLFRGTPKFLKPGCPVWSFVLFRAERYPLTKNMRLNFEVFVVKTTLFLTLIPIPVPPHPQIQCFGENFEKFWLKNWRTNFWIFSRFFVLWWGDGMWVKRIDLNFLYKWGLWGVKFYDFGWGGTLNDRSNLNFLVFLQNITYFSFFIVSKNLHYTFR